MVKKSARGRYKHIDSFFQLDGFGFAVDSSNQHPDGFVVVGAEI